jgi:hypothetical protein
MMASPGRSLTGALEKRVIAVPIDNDFGDAVAGMPRSLTRRSMLAIATPSEPAHRTSWASTHRASCPVGTDEVGVAADFGVACIAACLV